MSEHHESHVSHSHSSSFSTGGGFEHITETVTLSRTSDGHTDALTVTRDGDEVRVVVVRDGETTEDRIAYSGADAKDWLRGRMIEWQEEGYEA